MRFSENDREEIIKLIHKRPIDPNSICNLKDWIKAKQINMVEFCFLAKINRSLMYKIKTNKRPITKKLLNKISLLTQGVIKDESQINFELFDK